MLAPYAQATLAEFKRRFPATGTGKDSSIEDAINEASRDVMRETGRRFVFWAPTEDDDNIVAATALDTAGTLTLAGGAAAALTAGRTLVVTVTDADYSITAGTLTVTGTVAGATTTEAFDLSGGYLGAPFGPSRYQVLYGVKFFTAIASAVVTGMAGATATVDTVKIGTSLGYVDYLTPRYGRAGLWLPDWPARQVLSVYEDASCVYGSTTLLVAGTDYRIGGDDAGRPGGVLKRLSGGVGSACWSAGDEAVKVTWSGGAFTPANVPADVKAIAIRTAASYYFSESRKDQGVSSMSDAAGNFTRFGEPGLSRSDRDKLASYTNYDEERAYRRGFDQEAA